MTRGKSGDWGQVGRKDWIDTWKEKEGGMCKGAPGGKSQDLVMAGGWGEGDS